VRDAPIWIGRKTLLARRVGCVSSWGRATAKVRYVMPSRPGCGARRSRQLERGMVHACSVTLRHSSWCQANWRERQLAAIDRIVVEQSGGAHRVHSSKQQYQRRHLALGTPRRASLRLNSLDHRRIPLTKACSDAARMICHRAGSVAEPESAAYWGRQ